MKAFGIIAVLVTVALIAWFMVGQSDSPYSEEKVADYQSAIDSAHEAVGNMGGVSSKSVFVYEGITVPDDVRFLDLSGKNLSGSLMAEVRHLRSLRELDISNNNFTGLPAEIGQLPELRVLNISNNPFTGLPLELGNLSSLKILDLRGTNYSRDDLDKIRESLPNTQILVD